MTYVRPYPEAQPLPPPRARSQPQAARAFISERQAVDVAFQICRDRSLAVSTVKHAHLDGAGRWHVDLRGRDRAKLLLDARDGRLLKGQFKQKSGDHVEDEEWGD
jgi:hypothetical protein